MYATDEATAVGHVVIVNHATQSKDALSTHTVQTDASNYSYLLQEAIASASHKVQTKTYASSATKYWSSGAIDNANIVTVYAMVLHNDCNGTNMGITAPGTNDNDIQAETATFALFK